MKRQCKVDYKQLQQLRDNLGKLEKMDMEQFCNRMSKELAARLLSLVIPLTPLGNYKIEVQRTATRDTKYHKKGEVYTTRINPTGKVGGTLRRGWTARTEAEAQQGSGSPQADEITEYANSLPIQKSGNKYTVTVINPVHYASYVEFGHRQQPGRYIPALGKSLKERWVKGRYMLTISEEKIRQKSPAWIAKELEKLLREAFNV